MQSKLTNSLLAIIAGCLVFQVSQSLKSKTIASQSSALAPGVQTVKVVEPLAVNVVGIGGKPLDEVAGRVVLPVGVRNTVEVDIKGVDGGLTHVFNGSDGLPVVIINK